MIAHEDTTAPRWNILESAYIDLDSGRAHASVCDPHRSTIESSDVANQQRVRDSNNSGNETERDIDKDELESREHSILRIP